ncbi:hypothetical protein LJC59_07920 [Desulfovibrio sp. OttesenSCG-928-A18]|nr:hypothetical protein [Desulfovibrio sp. OttesenSCG-928-A18]
MKYSLLGAVAVAAGALVVLHTAVFYKKPADMGKAFSWSGFTFRFALQEFENKSLP